jgi:hypothetical protein
MIYVNLAEPHYMRGAAASTANLTIEAKTTRIGLREDKDPKNVVKEHEC